MTLALRPHLPLNEQPIPRERRHCAQEHFRGRHLEIPNVGPTLCNMPRVPAVRIILLPLLPCRSITTVNTIKFFVLYVICQINAGRG